jgi:hypothetical protein
MVRLLSYRIELMPGEGENRIWRGDATMYRGA